MGFGAQGRTQRTVFHADAGGYVRYVRGPFALGRYLLLVTVFALGLMAKPMLVTLPLVLLLLDYWPLGRMTSVAQEDGRLPAEGNRAVSRFSCVFSSKSSRSYSWRPPPAW